MTENQANVLLDNILTLKNLLNGISEDLAEIKPEGKWSIKEHIGHLADLELLHIGRLNDFIFRIPELRSADMTNAATYQATHNQKTITELIEHFVTERNLLISHLKKL